MLWSFDLIIERKRERERERERESNIWYKINDTMAQNEDTKHDDRGE